MRRPGWTVALTALTLVLAVGLGSAVAAVITPRRVLGHGLRLGCENSRATPQLLVEPTRCLIFDATQTSQRSVNLHKMRWSRWSSSGARGTGIDCGFHLPCENVAVRVTLSRLKRVRCARNDYRVFTRARVTSRFGTTTVGPPVCPKGEG